MYINVVLIPEKGNVIDFRSRRIMSGIDLRERLVIPVVIFTVDMDRDIILIHRK